MTAQSALIIPVPEAEAAVGHWRERFDPSAPAGIPAHVTILYPFLTPSRLDSAVLEELRSLFASSPSFQASVTGFAQFAGVLYLTPEPPGPFVRLTAAVATRWPETPPYEGAFTGIIPHLTVARTDDPGVWDTIRAAIEPRLPIESRVWEVWLLTSDGARWHRRYRFALGSC